MCDDHRTTPTPGTWDRRRLLVGTGASVLATGLMTGLVPGASAARIHAARARQVAPGLAILPRSAWGADLAPLWSIPHESDVRLLLVHHTASPNTWTPINTMRVAYWTHTREKGWPDVCYQFFVARDGTVYEGRAGSLDGTTLADATGGSQGYSQLVCMIGDYTAERPTPAARASLVKTLAFLAERSRVATTPGSTTTFVSRGSQRWPVGATVTSPTIAPHRAMSYTSCPGDAFAPYTGPGLMLDVDRQRRRWRRAGWRPDR